MTTNLRNRALLALLTFFIVPSWLWPSYQMEYLPRGLVAVRASDSEVFLSWRFLGTDPDNISFNVYRATGDGHPEKINGAPLTSSTNFLDRYADLSQVNHYFVRPLHGGVGQPSDGSFTLPADAPVRNFFSVPLNKPADVTSSAIGSYTYSANDTSVADLTGDGQYEFIVKWDPSNSKDNAHSGYTGNVYLDAYTMDGTQLWRIDLGINIRAGAHYTQFLVYDFDGDGKAELVCRTSDGSIDGTGAVIGTAGMDYRAGNGYILTGPEYLTIFNGETGAAMASTPYLVERGDVGLWRDGGGGYGNRVDRFLAAVAYLDGERPSLVMCRGYYTRTALVAWDWRDGQLTHRWTFDTDPNQVINPALSAYRGQGNHSLTVGDVDGDGKDEIVYGAMAVDDDGTGLWTSGLGHGDAAHLSDMDPDRPGLEYFTVHESPSSYGEYGSSIHDAATGAIIYGAPGGGTDVGRGVAADIDPRHPGYETWASRGGLWNIKGTFISDTRPGPMNFLVYWDGDPLRELLDGTTISKWNWEAGTLSVLFNPPGVSSNNGTKSNPALSADLFGDWREEVVWRTTDSSALRIYTTTIPTDRRITTLMHDRQYRLAIAWQNVAYNQPPHPSFFIGHDMPEPPRPSFYVITPEHVTPPTSAEARFAQWLEAKGLAPDADPDSDPHGRGLSLRHQYAFGIDGSGASTARVDGDQVVLDLLLARAEFDYTIEHSDDLENWSPLMTLMGNDEAVSVDLPTSTAGAFFRLGLKDFGSFNTFPTITLTAPANGAEFELGETVSIAADATDVDGSIASVEFFLDGNLVATDTEAPFAHDWTPGAIGTYTFNAIVTDNLGAKGYSSSATVTVKEVPVGVATSLQAEDATVGPHDWGIESTNGGFNGTG
jgi:hypothetical protein